jgi:hypothetical protein
MQELGPLPSYAQGLFKTGGTSSQPQVMDLGKVLPFETAANVINAGVHFNKPLETEQLAQYFTPALAMALHAATHSNSYGQPSKASTLINMLAGFGSTTPEMALWQRLHAKKKDQSRHMYVTDPRYAIWKALFGTVTPRTENRIVGNSNYEKQRKAAGR